MRTKDVMIDVEYYEEVSEEELVSEGEPVSEEEAIEGDGKKGARYRYRFFK